jgi:hypothetical protein
MIENMEGKRVMRVSAKLATIVGVMVVGLGIIVVSTSYMTNLLFSRANYGNINVVPSILILEQVT